MREDYGLSSRFTHGIFLDPNWPDLPEQILHIADLKQFLAAVGCQRWKIIESAGCLEIRTDRPYHEFREILIEMPNCIDRFFWDWKNLKWYECRWKKRQHKVRFL